MNLVVYESGGVGVWWCRSQLGGVGATWCESPALSGNLKIIGNLFIF